MHTLESTIASLFEARRLLKTGRPQEALECLNSGRLKEYASSHLVRAECLYQLGRFEEVKLELGKTLREAPTSPMALLLDDLCDAKLRARPSSPDELRFALLLTETFAPIPEAQAERPAPIHEVDGEDPGLVSETLARIMVEQEKYSEARKVYIHLARENPDRYEHFKTRIAEMDAAIEAHRNQPG